MSTQDWVWVTGKAYVKLWASLVAQMVESACNVGDLGLILGWEDPLEEMATYSSILAWRVPWTEEPGGLRFMGSQSVGCN